MHGLLSLGRPTVELARSTKGVAVLVAAGTRDAVVGKFMRHWVRQGFTGRIITVNVGASRNGLAYTSAVLAALPEDVDTAIVAVGRDTLEDVLNLCAVHGIRVVAVWIINARGAEGAVATDSDSGGRISAGRPALGHPIGRGEQSLSSPSRAEKTNVIADAAARGIQHHGKFEDSTHAPLRSGRES